MAVLKFDPEHCVGEGFPDDALHLDGFFFSHGYSLEKLGLQYIEYSTCAQKLDEIVCTAVMNVNKGTPHGAWT